MSGRKIKLFSRGERKCVLKSSQSSDKSLDYHLKAYVI